MCRGCAPPPQRMPLGTRACRRWTAPDLARQHPRTTHRAAPACACPQAAAAFCTLPVSRTLPQARAATPTTLHTFLDTHSAPLPLRRRSGSRRRSHQPGELCSFARCTQTHGLAHSPARAHSTPSPQRSLEPPHCAPQVPSLAALGSPAAARSRTAHPRCAHASCMVHPHVCGVAAAAEWLPWLQQGVGCEWAGP